MRSLILTTFLFIFNDVQSSYPAMTCYYDSGYINDWDEHLDNVQAIYFMNGVYDSIHNNNNEDRRWKYNYCRQDSPAFIAQSTLSSTPYDDYWIRNCPSNQAIIGGISDHNNYHEDRVWSWYCGGIDTSKYEFDSCTDSGYVNGYDSTFSYYCPSNGVITGIYATHNNNNEDRRWGFSCCRIKDVPTQPPTVDPTIDPTYDPTADPSSDPSYDPTTDPTQNPTIDPTVEPTVNPTQDPTEDPTTDPTTHPTNAPTQPPTKKPTKDPTLDVGVEDTTKAASTTELTTQNGDVFNTEVTNNDSLIYILMGVIAFLICCFLVICMVIMVRKKKKKDIKKHNEILGSSMEMGTTNPDSTTNPGEGADFTADGDTNNSTIPSNHVPGVGVPGPGAMFVNNDLQLPVMQLPVLPIMPMPIMPLPPPPLPQSLPDDDNNDMYYNDVNAANNNANYGDNTTGYDDISDSDDDNNDNMFYAQPTHKKTSGY